MDLAFNHTSHSISPDMLSWIDLASESAATIGSTALIATLVSALAYLSYTPKVDKKSPAFTSDTFPFIGSWRFFTQKIGFWKKSMAESKTGNFSFWLGKNHIVGVSGEAARKMYLDDRRLHLIKGITLIGHGPDFIDGRSTVIHDIWKGTGSSDRSYAVRRLLDLQRSDLLVKRLPRVTKDARVALEAIAANLSPVINPSKVCYRLVVKQGARVVGADEISDDPKLLDALLSYMPILQFTSSLHLLAVPWLSYFSLSYWKRRYGRWGVTKIVTPLVNKRMEKDAARVDDALQTLIDHGDSKDYITNFLISMLFITGANAGVISGSMLNIVAHHPDWQEKMYREIKAAANTHSRNKNASLVDQLDSLPFDAWEDMSSSIDLCYKEAIRMWVAFPMGRFNDSPNPIPIPGTNEVIPPGSFACYNTVDVHYSEKLYPDPMKWEPERWLEGREEFKKEAYGWMGWGAGRHPCVGMRWAKIQQNIILAYALALYKWSGCDENGELISKFQQPTHALDHLAPKLPQGTHCKFVPREAE
ncbi:putative cytochrome P450 [Mollisia scopiformis]|uniref:Putative cytochrome P450 n=1 Tax=Mollisia scopiformis TaxID=149040 RepID=A0A194WVQ8_MOLSC|nr:putative cytochrome P450 [Mollisia scopiformis]KUJ11672.1 putative cytochrome P450 [Mollisia scopiformis]